MAVTRVIDQVFHFGRRRLATASSPARWTGPGGAFDDETVQAARER